MSDQNKEDAPMSDPRAVLTIKRHEHLVSESEDGSVSMFTWEISLNIDGETEVWYWDNRDCHFRFLQNLVRRLAGFTCGFCGETVHPTCEYCVELNHLECSKCVSFNSGKMGAFRNKYLKVVLGTGCWTQPIPNLKVPVLESHPIPALAPLVKVCQELGVEITRE